MCDDSAGMGNLIWRLCKHLVNNNILTNEQFGFRANSSTDKAIYRLLDHILMALNDGHNVEEYSVILKNFRVR
jgi:hypothetical protein